MAQNARFTYPAAHCMRVTPSDSTSARQWPCDVMIRAVRAQSANSHLVPGKPSGAIQKTGISPFTITKIERTKLNTKLQTDTTIYNHDHHLNEPPRSARHSGALSNPATPWGALQETQPAVDAALNAPPRWARGVLVPRRAAHRDKLRLRGAARLRVGSVRVHECSRAAGRGSRGAAASTTAPGRPAHW
jgi:hypothetical protein